VSKSIDPQTSLQAMHETGPKLAQARADRVFLEEYRKSLKAMLMQTSLASSVAMKEVEAYSDDTYVKHLHALKIAVEAEETLRWRMVTAQTAIEVWRSQEASNRNMDRAAA
jgi:hypothetical protein